MSTKVQILPPKEVANHFRKDENKTGASVVIPLLELSGGTLPKKCPASYKDFCDSVLMSEDAIKYYKTLTQKTYYVYITEVSQMLQGATKLNAFTRQRIIVWLVKLLRETLPSTGWNIEVFIEYADINFLGDLRSLGRFDTPMTEYLKAIEMFTHNSMNEMEK